MGLNNRILKLESAMGICDQVVCAELYGDMDEEKATAEICHAYDIDPDGNAMFLYIPHFCEPGTTEPQRWEVLWMKIGDTQ